MNEREKGLNNTNLQQHKIGLEVYSQKAKLTKRTGIIDPHGSIGRGYTRHMSSKPTPKIDNYEVHLFEYYNSYFV